MVNSPNTGEVAFIPYRSICPDIVTRKERIRLEDGAAREAVFGLDGSAGVSCNRFVGGYTAWRGCCGATGRDTNLGGEG